jgi:excisionase family DNA binding protein
VTVASPSILVTPEFVEAVAMRVAEILAPQWDGARPEPRYMSLAEAASFLHWPRHRIYKLTAAGTIPHIKHGNRLLFDRESLNEWLAEHTVRPRGYLR